MILTVGCSSSPVTGQGGSTTTTTTSTTTSTSTTTASTTTASTTTAADGSCVTGGCGAQGYCQFPYAECTDSTFMSIPMPGSCTVRPVTCDQTQAPVCGCDGKVYQNACLANLAGLDVGATACAASVTPDKYIPCGPLYCDPSATYCQIGEGNAGDTYWNCVALPAACQGTAPVCTCLGTLPSGQVCTVVQGTGVSGLQVEMTLM
jgi:hypothetical protein